MSINSLTQRRGDLYMCVQKRSTVSLTLQSHTHIIKTHMHRIWKLSTLKYMRSSFSKNVKFKIKISIAAIFNDPLKYYYIIINIYYWYQHIRIYTFSLVVEKTNDVIILLINITYFINYILFLQIKLVSLFYVKCHIKTSPLLEKSEIS